MGLFDFLKRKNKETPSRNELLLAMPLFVNSDSYDLTRVTNHIKGFWDLDVSITGDNDSAVLDIDGERIALAFMDLAVPKGDIEGTAQYAYNWPTVLEDLQGHDGHGIVTVFSDSTPVIDRFLLLSKVLFSILTTSSSIGVYKGSQTLLIPKDQYIGMAGEIKNGEFPIPLWIYIGLRNYYNTVRSATKLLFALHTMAKKWIYENLYFRFWMLR
jgi:hypothetical protein